MGQKVHALGLRLIYGFYFPGNKGSVGFSNSPSEVLGIDSLWNSYWYAKIGKSYGSNVLEDYKIRRYISSNVAKGTVSKVFISRKGYDVSVSMKVVRSKNISSKIKDFESDLSKSLGKAVKIKVYDERQPDLSASVVADVIAKQIEKRGSHKRAMKKAISSSMSMGAKGIKVMCSGRLAGAEIARSEHLKDGKVPLHFLRASVDYAAARANTTYGVIGIKVWIYRG